MVAIKLTRLKYQQNGKTRWKVITSMGCQLEEVLLGVTDKTRVRLVTGRADQASHQKVGTFGGEAATMFATEAHNFC
jgi:hypothetical protein